MKTHLKMVAATALSLFVTAVYSQPGVAPGHSGMGMGMGRMGPAQHGPDLSGANSKLFANTPAFTAQLEFQSKGPGGEPTAFPGKLAFDHGKTRFEIDMNEKAGAGQAAARMKSMGMDKIITISRPDQKETYMIYPGLQAYAAQPMKPGEAAEPANDYKVTFTELGKETVEGHPAVKTKAVVTDKEGKQHESTVWKATDLKDFPIKIEQNEDGSAVTMLFKEVKLSAPDASAFEPPKDFTKYNSVQAMMREVMMKRFGGGFAPGRPPQREK